MIFVLFYKNVLAARVRSMVAKGAFMQKFENSFSELLKETQNVQLWGVKSPCARPCGVQNLVAVAERTAMAPLGCEFCAPSVLPFVLFLFNKPFLITFFQKNAFRRLHFSSMMSSSCTRRFCIACFLSPTCSCVPKHPAV